MYRHIFQPVVLLSINKIHNKMRTYLWFCILIFGFIPSAGAQQVSRRLSLEELFSLGMENSLSVKSAETQEQIAEEQWQTAKAERLPDIRVGLEAGNIGQPIIFRRGLTRPEYPETPDWRQNYNVELTQPLYDGGRIRSGIRQGKIRRHIALLNTANSKESLKLQLLQRYMELFTLYKQKEVLARNIDESVHRLEDIRRMRKEGLLTRNDELRSELQLTNDKLDYSETEHQIILASQALDILLGLGESLLLVPDTTVLDATFSVNALEDYIQMAYEHNLAMKIARENTLLTRNNVASARSELLPALSLRAGNTLARPVSSTMEDYYNNSWNITLNVSFNLSSLYRGRHRVREAEHNVQSQLYAEELQKQAIRSDVRSAYIRNEESLERVKALMLSVSQASENYRIMQNRYLNQLSILTDLLDASNVRLEAELRLVSAKAETVYTYYELQRICGKL